MIRWYNLFKTFVTASCLTSNNNSYVFQFFYFECADFFFFSPTENYWAIWGNFLQYFVFPLHCLHVAVITVRVLSQPVHMQLDKKYSFLYMVPFWYNKKMMFHQSNKIILNLYFCLQALWLFSKLADTILVTTLSDHILATCYCIVSWHTVKQITK